MTPTKVGPVERRVANGLLGLQLMAPLVFVVLGTPQVALYSLVLVAISAVARATLGRIPLRATVAIFSLSVDLGSLSFGYLFGRDSWVIAGLLFPFVLSIPLLLDAPKWVRFASLGGRVLVFTLAVGLYPAAPQLDPPPPDHIIRLLRFGSANFSAGLLATAVTLGLYFARRKQRELQGVAIELQRQLTLHADTEIQLAAALAEIEAVESQRREFLRRVSHELRNPLAMVRGLAEAMQEEAEARGDDVLVGDLREMLTAERRLHEAVENLLEVARMERRQLGTDAMLTVADPDEDEPELRVLVVDDVQVNGEVLVSRLAALGAEALWVGSGEDAIRICSIGEPFDLILMDLDMPGMNGYETAQRLCRAGYCKRGSIVAVTAHEDPRTLQRCLDAGMAERRLKPLGRDDLLELLHRSTTPGNASGSGRLDAAVLGELSKELEDPEFLRDMVRWFATSAESRIAEGESATASGDAATVERAAHSLHGLAGTVGALRLQLMARTLEQTARKEGLPAISQRWAEAREELHEVQSALTDQWLAGSAP